MSPAIALLSLLAQAVPAPAPPPSPSPTPAPAEPEAEPQLLGWSLGVGVGASYRLPPAGDDVPPPAGFTAGTSVGWRYLRAGRAELGVQVAFSYQKFSRTVQYPRPLSPGNQTTAEGTRSLSMGDFTALQTVAVALGRFRPWVGVGGGVSLDHFASPETRYEPGEARRTVPLVRGALGFHLEVAPQTDGGLTLDWVHGFTSNFDTKAGESLGLFGDRVAVRLEMQYRF